MAEKSAEAALQYLRDPVVVGSLGAVAAATMLYVATRPTPQKCPVDPNQQSVELPGEDHARVGAISNELVEYIHDDVRTLHETFMRGVRISGDRPCLGYRTSPDGPYEWLTYNEVLHKSTNAGSGLVELGSNTTEGVYKCIGVYAPNKPEWVYVEQGCSLYSMAIVPLYDTLGPEACVYIINQAKMATVVCDAAKISLLLDKADQCTTLKTVVKIGPPVTEEEKSRGEKLNLKLISFTELEELGKNCNHPVKPAKPEDLSTVCYTSGTTGNPKGAMITHANAVAMVSGLMTMVNKCGIILDHRDVHISYLPLAHMYERLAHIMVFTHGARVGFFGGNVRRILEDLQELKPTIFISVPRVLNRVYDKVIKQVSSSKIAKFLFDWAISSKSAELERNIVRKNSIWDYLVFRKIQNSLGGRVRFVISGSAPLRDDVMKFLRCSLGCYVLEGYGQTESTAAASIQLMGDNTYGHVGPPLPCNKIKLVDVPDMNYFAKDGRGEICFYGPNVFKGYLYDPEKTREAIDEDGWLHSGDIGEWLPNGTLKLVDRKKHIFKLSQGEYIAPEKIETVYTQCPLVHQVYVYGESTRSYLVAVVVPEEGPLRKWTETNGVEGDMNTLCQNEAVNRVIYDEIIAEGKKEQLKSFEQVKLIALHPEQFSVDNGLLTPTLKFRRSQIKKHFLDTFNELYSHLQE